MQIALSSRLPEDNDRPGPRPPSPSQDWREQARLREIEQRKAHAIEIRQRLWEASGVPPRFLDADVADIGDVSDEQTKVMARMIDLLAAPGMLALVGTRGSGKTWMSAALIREFCRKAKSARYRRAMDVFRAIKATFGKRGENERDVIDDLSRPDLLVLDEMQVRSETDWENDVLIDLVDSRYAHLKSTVMIANLAPAALVKNVGDSITSRLQEAGGILLCNWESYRANGKARPAAQPVRDTNTDTYEYTPVVEGAIPRKPGWAGRGYCG